MRGHLVLIEKNSAGRRYFSFQSNLRGAIILKIKVLIEKLCDFFS